MDRTKRENLFLHQTRRTIKTKIILFHRKGTLNTNRWTKKSAKCVKWSEKTSRLLYYRNEALNAPSMSRNWRKTTQNASNGAMNCKIEEESSNLYEKAEIFWLSRERKCLPLRFDSTQELDHSRERGGVSVHMMAFILDFYFTTGRKYPRALFGITALSLEIT